MPKVPQIQYWVKSKNRGAKSAVSAFNARDAVMQAKKLIRQGAQEIAVKDPDHREVSLEELTRTAS